MYSLSWAALLAIFALLGPWRPGAGLAKKSANSQACGGPSNYCANSTRELVPETRMVPPPANRPFRDPDFGSRMVRVTDAHTMGGISFHTDSAGETNEWGRFDPRIGRHGGYRFWVDANGGGALPYELDATTMEVVQITGRHARGLRRMGTLPVAGEFSYTNPDVLFGAWGTKIMEYSFTTGKVKQIYDFDRCPGLPKHLEKHMHTGGFTISGDDTKFAYTFGGGEQDQSKLAVFYDRSAKRGAGACYWYDSKFGAVGGTSMPPGRVEGGVGQLAAPAAPNVTASPGSGNLPPGDYYVEITARSRLDQHFGETLPSPEDGPIHLASAGSLTITFPALSNPDLLSLPPKNSGCWTNTPHCPPFDVYIGTSSGSERLQNTREPVGGRSYTQASPLLMSSPHPPSTNTAGYTIHDARMSKSGSEVRITEAFRGTEYFWVPGTAKITPCITWPPNRQVAGYCGGHLAMGYSHLVNATGYFDDLGVVIHPLSDLKQWRLLVDPLPKPVEWREDKHFSWSDANPSDTMPVCGSLYVDANVRRGNGTQNVLTNPPLQIRRAWDREIFCLATTGPSKVWRFAHDRATGTSNASAPVSTDFWATPRGNVSQDGKFYIFTSNWEWSLGNENGSHGCPTRGTCRTDVFIVELH
jgi:hypothetical protein